MAADNNWVESKEAQVKDLLDKLYNAETSKECAEHADKLGALLKEEGILGLERYGIIDNFSAAVKNKKSGIARESGLIGFVSLFRSMGPTTEPMFIPILPLILGAYADKGDVVREAAESAIRELSLLPPPY
ncbi:[NU+] prion formation protein 1 [Basidiobolus ranarum]|uniref:[NU+] prion formation protein 1 n=1 Tax=Basidiobolus ranarum TaxID=34480 RepID=A0ABR2VM44_9FUNG